MVARLRVLALACLVLLGSAVAAEPSTIRMDLRDASIDLPSDDRVVAYPSLAENQGRSIVQRDVGTDFRVDKDIPPPPCEPHWYNGWCAFSTTSTCKANRTCDEGLCLELSNVKCYTYQDSSGTQRCNSC